MTAAPLVSVVLPVRNAERTLERALRSCLEQTFADLELIVVNDGSGDGSGDLAAWIAEEDERVRKLAREAGFHEGRDFWCAA